MTISFVWYIFVLDEMNKNKRNIISGIVRLVNDLFGFMMTFILHMVPFFYQIQLLQKEKVKSTLPMIRYIEYFSILFRVNSCFIIINSWLWLFDDFFPQFFFLTKATGKSIRNPTQLTDTICFMDIIDWNKNEGSN